MGLFSRKIEAQNAPQVMGDNFNSLQSYVIPTLTRREAMSVPALKRCRDLICTVATFPLEYKLKSTGEDIPQPRWVEQPSLSQPRFVTMGWTIDSLLMYGTAYWEITSEYSEDGRGASFDWVSNTRVTYDLDLYGTTVKQYYVDGVPRPMSGLGSLVTFQAFNEGILSVGSKIIRQSIDIQNAAAVAAETPMGATYLKNTGADLPPAEVQGLLAAWKRARKNGSTAYLTSTIDAQNIGFSPKDMMYTDAIQNNATEIARLCGVPAYYVSADQNRSMTYANVIDERKQMVALCFQPYISAIESRLSMNDISTAGHEVKFSLDDAFLRTEPMDRLMVVEKMLSLGLIDLNQAKAMEDLAPDGGDA